ncbi:MAG: hypothetical protein IK102_01345 [Treponema sp.]|nr:hypothetical protein [Treponema sp.]
MKKTLLKVAVLTAFLSVLLTGCPGGTGNSGGNNPFGGNNGNDNVSEDTDNPISGTLTGDTETWAGKDAEGNPITYYIKKNNTYTIKDGGMLVIEEGAIVKLGAGAGITVGVGGTLEATGVIFTSAKDTRGRKINSAGQDAPKPADWENVYINGGYATLTNCEVSYGGSGCSAVNVNKSGSSFGRCKIDGCKFTYNSGTNSVSSTVQAAVKYDYTLTYGSDNTVTNTTFENNVWPISLPVTFSVSGTNHFGTGDKANKFNLIHMFYDNITGDVELKHTEVPYLFATGNSLDIGFNSKSGTLTIEGGTEDDPTVVQFYKQGFHIIKNTGTLNLGNYIHFTNCNYTSNTKYNGISCHMTDVPYVNSNGNNASYTGYVLLLSNDEIHVTIDGYDVGTSYSKDYMRQPIQSSNVGN